jgi:endoglucanase
MPSQTVLPRWRGFNLLDMFTMKSTGPFRESDFQLISSWGFDFVRLPLCYTLWCAGEGEDVYRIREDRLAMIDQAVEYGRKYGIHVCVNFHRAPGFSVNAERKEPFDLWKDQAALDACTFHWKLFARRYAGIGSDRVSFNLVNEPMTPQTDPARGMTRADHERVVRALVKAIREEDPKRLVIADGVNWGNDASPELADLKIVQSCRAYTPFHLTHYKAHWCGDQKWVPCCWPFTDPGGRVWDRAALEEHYQPWTTLASRGVGVHCGEGGAYQFTPHDTVLAWMRDWLEVLKSHNIGFALWNFRGSFGVLDSGRADVAYEDHAGHKLDRKMLDLIRSM